MNRKFIALGWVVVYGFFLDKHFVIVFLLCEIGNDQYRLRRMYILMIVFETPNDTLWIWYQIMRRLNMLSVQRMNAIPYDNIKSLSEKSGRLNGH